MKSHTALSFGGSPAILRVLGDGQHFARLGDPILILGERGTGKTAMAQHLHAISGRPGPFIPASAAALPRGMEAAALEGHRRGSFTGALSDQMGLLEAAHTGTFFLDELGSATGEFQSILLSLIENRMVRRVGDVRSRPVDVRFIAATNEDLQARIGDGTFRADLFDRFGCMTLHMPRLADRKDEILPLAEHFLEAFGSEAKMLDPPSLSSAVRECFMAAGWPGNIRQLRAVCRAAAARAAGGVIDVDHLDPAFVSTLGRLGRRKYDKVDHQRERLRMALEKAGGNRTQVARLLGMSRTHLYRVIAACGLEIVQAL